MANRIKGITIEIAGDNSKLAKTLDQTKKQLVDTSNELKAVNKLLKLDPSNVTLLGQKQELLKKQIEGTAERLKQLKELQEQFGDKSKLTDEQKEKYRLLEREIAQCEGQLKNYQKQQEDVNGAIDDVNKGKPFKNLNNDLEDTGKKALKVGDIIKANLISDAIVAGFKKLSSAIKGVANTFEAWSDMANTLKEQEAKVAQVMRNTTNATDEQIKSIIDLTAKQEKLGVVSQETQLAGLQELGTYVEHKESLEKLLPVMNDMIAQQYGIGASMESASGIATMMGKVLGNGQVDALSRLGYKFDETQKKVLKFGTEEEKVEMLTKIITQSVGGMNKALAQTDAGKMEIARARMDDLKKSIGETYSNIKNKLLSTIATKLMPTLEKAGKAFQKWAKSVDWNKVGDTIKKALDKVIDAFKWIIGHAEEIIKFIGLIIGAFAVAKIVEFGKKTIDVITNIYESCKTLFALIAAHPIMALVSAVGLLATAYLTFRDNTNAAIEAEEKHKKALEEELSAIDDANEAWKDLKNTQQQQIDNGLSEMQYYESLVSELDSITDANGKVKEGYEDRASFIVDKLSSALDIEIDKEKSLNGQVKDLRTNIDELLKKKKAQIILNAQEELYAEAIKKEEEASYNLLRAEDAVNAQKEKIVKTSQEIARYQDMYNEAVASGNTKQAEAIRYHKNELEELNKKQYETLKSLQDKYNKAEETVREYTYNKAMYEQNMVAAQKGAYDEMITISYNYVKEYEKAEDAERQQAEDHLRASQARLRELYRIRNESNQKQIDAEIEKQKKIVDEAQKGLDRYNWLSGNKLNENLAIWDAQMDVLLSDLTGQNVRFYKTADGNVQMYINGVKEGTPKSDKAMRELIASNVTQLTKGTQYEKAGEDIVNGIIKGVNIKKGAAYTAIANLGSSLLTKLKKSLNEHSPSKATNEMGQFLDEGLIMGIKKKQSEVLKSAQTLGTTVLGGLNSSLTGNVSSAITGYQNAMKSLNSGVESSVNPIINPTANSNPLYITIDKFYNNRQTDIKQLAEELEFYRKNSALAKGGV